MTKNLTTGSPARLILGFALPTLLGLLFQQMYNMVDTMIVGKLLGSGALAAVGATASINFLVIGFCMGMCSGFAIPVAQQMGAGDHSRMRSYAANAVWLTAGFAALLTVCTCLLCRTILHLMHTPADIIDQSRAYILVIFLGIPATLLYNLLAGMIRALGDSRTPVYFLALSSVLNIGLDFLFILCTDMGVAGAALATVLSQALSGLACLAYVFRCCPILHADRTERRLDRGICSDLCMAGIPMGLQYSVTAIGSIILQSAVNGLGSLSVAAVAAGTKLYQVMGCPFEALGTAMATYSGQNAGARKTDRLSQGLRDGAFLGLTYAVLAAAAMTVAAPWCAMCFIDAQDENVGVLLAMVSQYIRITTRFFFGLAIVDVFRFTIQGMGYSVFAILSGVTEMAARIAVAVWLIPAFGFDAACYASPVAWVSASLFLIPASVWCIRRQKRSQILPGESEPMEQYGRVPQGSAAKHHRGFSLPRLRLGRSKA